MSQENYPVFKADHNKEKPIILNMLDLFEALYTYIESNKETFLPLLTEEDAVNYDNYLNLVKAYYTEEQSSFAKLSAEECLLTYNCIPEKAEQVIQTLFPFNLLYALRDTKHYPIPVEGNLIEEIAIRLKVANINNMKVALSKFGVPLSQIEAMLNAFMYSYLCVDDPDRGFILELEVL